MNRRRFVRGIVTDPRIGGRETLHVRRGMQAAAATESPRKGGAKHNLFNSTKKMPGSTDFNFIAPGIAVQNYTSDAQGQEATVRTLLEEQTGYRKIRRRIRLNAPGWAIVDAIVESAWGTGEAMHDDETLAEVVFDEIQRGIKGNRLDELEAIPVAS